MHSNTQFSFVGLWYYGDINHQYLRSACWDCRTNSRNTLSTLFNRVTLQYLFRATMFIATFRKHEEL
jgi:hypothetical protein